MKNLSIADLKDRAAECQKTINDALKQLQQDTGCKLMDIDRTAECIVLSDNGVDDHSIVKVKIQIRI